MAEGSSAAERAMRHARQKSFRDLERQSRIGESIIRLVHQAQPDPTTVDGLEADLNEFISRTGREKGWIDLGVDDRIAAVGKRFGGSLLRSLHFARFAVYRHSSEVLHGTFFGAMYFLGGTSPSPSRKSIDEFTEQIGQQHMLILFATILGVSGIVEAFHRAYGFSEAYRESRKLMEQLQEIPYLHSRGSERSSE